jgi:hypothetical protein
MNNQSNPTHHNLLRNTLELIGGESLLSIEDIGMKSGKVTLEDVLRIMASSNISAGLEGANYVAHYPISVQLSDLVNIGNPEYAIEYLFSINYLSSREKGKVPNWEELLSDALKKLSQKYCMAKIKKLKKRLSL